MKMTIKKIKKEESKQYIDNPQYVKSIVKDFLNLTVSGFKPMSFFTDIVRTDLETVSDDHMYGYYLEDSLSYNCFTQFFDCSDLRVSEIICALKELCGKRTNMECAGPVYEFAYYFMASKSNCAAVNLFGSVAIEALYKEYKRLLKGKEKDGGIRDFVSEYGGCTVRRLTRCFLGEMKWIPCESPDETVSRIESAAENLMIIYLDMLGAISGEDYQEILERRFYANKAYDDEFFCGYDEEIDRYTYFDSCEDNEDN